MTEWNSTFIQVMTVGVGAEVCWPYRGQEKGAVENLVGWVKGSFFKQRRFLDKDDLLQQLAEWQGAVNTEIRSRATGRRSQRASSGSRRGRSNGEDDPSRGEAIG